MRLFKSANKSQASIDRLQTSSRSSSPDRSFGGAQFTDRPTYPSQPPTQPHPPLENISNIQYQDSQIHSHPAHVLTRISQEGGPGYVDLARRPSLPITVVHPISPQSERPPQLQTAVPVPGQTHFGQSKTVVPAPEKEHKRSKRSIFGLSSSKDKEKGHSPTERKSGGLGRSGSVHLLRRHLPQQQSVDIQSTEQQAQAPSYHQSIRHSAYFGRPDPPAKGAPEDPTHYEQYRQQQQVPGQYESPNSQYNLRSPEYAEDAPHFPTKEEQYQPYQQSESANTSEHYLPYHGQGQDQQQGRPVGLVADSTQTLRPPSDASLGPPSPLLHQQDSRPSTAATSRYSTQSIGAGPQQQQQSQNLQPQPQQQQPLPQMARGDPPNGNMRRDPRDDHYQQDPRMRMSQAVDQGRNTPPPRNREDPRELDYGQLLQKHEELQAKYSKVKRYYFEREAQVTQLQNTVANQRLSMSKTSLDDAQYSQRFERLSGAINNLAFNIRKDWQKVPPWLRPVCNADAHTTGTKEMTAVGRGCITRWLYETLFTRYFHPGLPPEVSGHLKYAENQLRRQGPIPTTEEQKDDLTTKITTWRLTTIEGFQQMLNSQEAVQNQEHLTNRLSYDLTKALEANLKDPSPPGLAEGVSTIISQAISLCANIPLESRDILITYPMPGELIDETTMKVETGMTPLTSPGEQPQQVQQQQEQGNNSEGSEGPEGERDVEAEIREAAGKASQTPGQQQRQDSVSSNNKSEKGSQSSQMGQAPGKQKSGGGFLGGFVTKKPTPQSANNGGRKEVQSPESEAEQRVPISEFGHPLVPGEGRVRFSAFLAVEVKGKMMGGDSQQKEGGGSAAQGVQSRGASASNVLYKASVYEL